MECQTLWTHLYGCSCDVIMEMCMLSGGLGSTSTGKGSQGAYTHLRLICASW